MERAKRWRRIVIGIIATLLVAGVLVYTGLFAAAFIIHKGYFSKEALVKGQVTLTNHGCLVDGSCYLYIQTTDQKDISVVYSYAYSPPINFFYFWTIDLSSCLNKKAAQDGLSIEEGDEIEVFGKYTDSDTISTCESLDYYIRKL